MTSLRLVLVFLLYLAAELVSPVAATPVEAFDGEAEESLLHAGPRRVARLAAERRSPIAADLVATSSSSAIRSTTPQISRPRANPVRKIPAAAPPDASPAPQDH